MVVSASTTALNVKKARSDLDGFDMAKWDTAREDAEAGRSDADGGVIAYLEFSEDTVNARAECLRKITVTSHAPTYIFVKLVTPTGGVDATGLRCNHLGLYGHRKKTDDTLGDTPILTPSLIVPLEALATAEPVLDCTDDSRSFASLRVDLDSGGDLPGVMLYSAVSSNLTEGVHQRIVDGPAEALFWKNPAEYNFTPYHIAVCRDSSSSLATLAAKVKAYCDQSPDAVDDDAWLAHHRLSPVHVAAATGHHDCLEVLLRNDFDCITPDEFGSTPLHWAAALGRVKCVDILLRRLDVRAIINNTNYSNHTALACAVEGAASLRHTATDADGQKREYDPGLFSLLQQLAAFEWPKGQLFCAQRLIEERADASLKFQPSFAPAPKEDREYGSNYVVCHARRKRGIHIEATVKVPEVYVQPRSDGNCITTTVAVQAARPGWYTEPSIDTIEIRQPDATLPEVQQRRSRFKNGHYYCGRPAGADDDICVCGKQCNRCRPDRGCNCEVCQELDDQRKMLVSRVQTLTAQASRDASVVKDLLETLARKDPELMLTPAEDGTGTTPLHVCVQRQDEESISTSLTGKIAATQLTSSIQTIIKYLPSKLCKQMITVRDAADASQLDYAVKQETLDMLLEVSGGKISQRKLALAIANDICTTSIADEDYAKQRLWGCKTCSIDPEQGFCDSCMAVCHATHDVEQSTRAVGRCFCGVGAHRGICCQAVGVLRNPHALSTGGVYATPSTVKVLAQDMCTVLKDCVVNNQFTTEKIGKDRNFLMGLLEHNMGASELLIEIQKKHALSADLDVDDIDDEIVAVVSALEQSITNGHGGPAEALRRGAQYLSYLAQLCKTYDNTPHKHVVQDFVTRRLVTDKQQLLVKKSQEKTSGVDGDQDKEVVHLKFPHTLQGDMEPVSLQSVFTDSSLINKTSAVAGKKRSKTVSYRDGAASFFVHTIEEEKTDSNQLAQAQKQFKETIKWQDAQKHKQAEKVLKEALQALESSIIDPRNTEKAETLKAAIKKALQRNNSDALKYRQLQKSQKLRQVHEFNESHDVLMQAAMDSQPALQKLIDEELKLVQLDVQALHSARRQYYTAQMALFVHCSTSRVTDDVDASTADAKGSGGFQLAAFNLPLLFDVVKTADRLFRNKKGQNAGRREGCPVCTTDANRDGEVGRSSGRPGTWCHSGRRRTTLHRRW